MKKTLSFLLLLVSMAAFTFVNAQPQIYRNPATFSVANGLGLSVYGLTGGPNEQYEVAVSKNLQPYITVQSTLAPLAGTAFIGQHNIPYSQLQLFQIWKWFGTLVSSSIMRTDTGCAVILLKRLVYQNQVMRLSNSNPMQDFMQEYQETPQSIRITSEAGSNGNKFDTEIITGEVIEIPGTDLVIQTVASEEEAQRLIASMSTVPVRSIDQITVKNWGYIIDFQNPTGVDFSWKLYDMSTKLVSEGRNDASATFAGFAVGMYVITVTDNTTGEVRSEKFMLQY